MSLVTDIRELLDESTAVFWTDQHVYDAANQALLEVYAHLRWTYTTANLSLTSGNDIVSIPATIMIPQTLLADAGGTGSRVEYFPTTHARLEQYSRQWRLATPAFPTHFVLWDAEKVRVFPRPNASYTFIVTGIPWPTEISAANLDITAPYWVKKAVMYRASASLVESTLSQLADVWMAEARESEIRFRKEARNQQSYAIARLRPGTAFTVAQGGNIQLGKNQS